LKPFIDPMTAEKLQFLQNHEAYSFLNERIDHDSIPANFGGDFKFKTGMLPNLDGEIRAALQLSGDLPLGPLKWIRGESGELKAVATGTVDGVQRREEIAVLSHQNGGNIPN
jgi:hypothetical protein